MLAYILTFLSGGIVFVSLLLLHQYSVRRATAKLQEEYRTRRENSRLRAENEELRSIVDARERCDEARDARERGKILGMQERRNQSAYEKFARAVNPDGQRKVQVGGGGK